MKITKIDCHVLLDPGYDIGSTSSAQDDLVVEIHTDEGISGIGETDVNPWIARACIEAPGTHTMGLGLTEMLMGQDPLQVEALWERLYTGSAMNGRRGAVIHAMGALDIALHDIRGKAMGKPCYEFLGGAARTHITRTHRCNRRCLRLRRIANRCSIGRCEPRNSALKPRSWRLLRSDPTLTKG